MKFSHASSKTLPIAFSMCDSRLWFKFIAILHWYFSIWILSNCWHVLARICILVLGKIPIRTNFKKSELWWCTILYRSPSFEEGINDPIEELPCTVTVTHRLEPVGLHRARLNETENCIFAIEAVQFEPYTSYFLFHWRRNDKIIYHYDRCCFHESLTSYNAIMRVIWASDIAVQKIKGGGGRLSG